ncbi:hypothetical protein CW713_03055 [Methanophagales archaeon]|nr:MAG: hypothetical protein CW713_03055 [Methanophagales archaeon]
MRDKGIWKILAISVVLAIVASSVAVFSAANLEEGIGEKGIDEGGGEGVISLVPPPFIGVAGASEVKGGSAFPEDEAGIAAYINTSQTISIEKIKTIFSKVERVGDNYIVGITPIPDFGGDIGVHVYADTDGWLVAYLKMDEPAAKIMKWETADVNNPNIGVISTTLVDALYKAGEAARVGIVASKIKYYDFEFPNANGMMIFVRTRATHGENLHQVEIPADYMLFEASYYYYIYYYSDYRYDSGSNWEHQETYWDSKLKVDGITIHDASTSYKGDGVYKWWRAFDSYKGAITTGTLHSITISYFPCERDGQGTWTAVDVGSAGVATVLIYRTA